VKLKLLLLCLALAVAGLSSLPLYADSTISIQNASFENYNAFTVTNCGTGCGYNLGPIPDWTGTGGSWQPGSAQFNFPLPDGNVLAYTNGGSISQDLGISLLPNSVYTLSVFVGDRLDGYSTGPYSIALDAGGTTLASLSGSGSDITSGTFADEILIFSTGQNVVSGDLSIVLASGGVQADFDDVSLTVGQNAAVPEPMSLILLVAGVAFVGLFSLLRRA
jgi:hypothetical protein